jgi:hypothetical protein
LNALHGLQNELADMESALAADDLSKLESILNEAQRKHQVLTS